MNKLSSEEKYNKCVLRRVGMRVIRLVAFSSSYVLIYQEKSSEVSSISSTRFHNLFTKF